MTSDPGNYVTVLLDYPTESRPQFTAGMTALGGEVVAVGFEDMFAAAEGTAAKLAKKDAEIAALQASLAKQESRANLYAHLNRRVAEALGRPTDGAGSSWHDMPEGIMALREQIESLKNLELSKLLRLEREDNARLQASLAALQEAARPWASGPWLEAEAHLPDDQIVEGHTMGEYRALAQAVKEAGNG